MVVVMFIYSSSDSFNMRGAICRTRKRQGVLSGHIISRRMEILEQMVPLFLNRSMLLWETCLQGARRKNGDDSQRGRLWRDLFCRVKARGAWQAAGDAGRWAEKARAAANITATVPLAQALVFFPQKSYFPVSHGLDETFLEVL